MSSMHVPFPSRDLRKSPGSIKSRSSSARRAEIGTTLAESVMIAAYATQTKWLYPPRKTLGHLAAEKGGEIGRGLTRLNGTTIVRGEFFERTFE